AETTRAAESARADLVDAVARSAGGVEDLSTRAERIRTALDESATRSADIQQRLQSRLEEARAILEQPIDALRESFDEITGRAEGVLEECHAAQQSAEDAAKWNAAVLVRVEQAISRLEPWSEVLLSTDGPAELPRPLQDVIGRAYVELSRPLNELGSVIQTVAQRVQMSAPDARGARDNIKVLAGRGEPRAARTEH
ncbi:MAG: hypothetical protein VYC34_02870, partial [Planctomycetota bacterium]|nr:hypothetical protein [Planctomycetota bacterium]